MQHNSRVGEGAGLESFKKTGLMFEPVFQSLYRWVSEVQRRVNEYWESAGLCCPWPVSTATSYSSALDSHLFLNLFSGRKDDLSSAAVGELRA